MLIAGTTHTAVIHDKTFTFPIITMTLCAPLGDVRVVDMRGHAQVITGSDCLTVLFNLSDQCVGVAYDDDRFFGSDVVFFPNGWQFDGIRMDADVPFYHLLAPINKCDVTFYVEPGQMITNVLLPCLPRNALAARKVLVQFGLRYEYFTLQRTRAEAETDDNDELECRCPWCVALADCTTIPVYVPEIEVTVEVIDGRDITAPICSGGLLRLMQNEGVLGAYCGFMQTDDLSRGILLSSVPNVGLMQPHIGFSMDSEWGHPHSCGTGDIVGKLEPCSGRCPTGCEIFLDIVTHQKLLAKYGGQQVVFGSRPCLEL
jgi:hypothetical protein